MCLRHVCCMHSQLVHKATHHSLRSLHTPSRNTLSQSWQLERLLARLTVAPFASLDALEVITEVLTTPLDTTFTTPILSRCVDVIQHDTQSLCATHPNSDDDDARLPSLCLDVMQRILQYRAEQAPSIAARATFAACHVKDPSLGVDVDAAFSEREAEYEDKGRRADSAAHGTAVSILAGLEKPLMDTVCASFNSLTTARDAPTEEDARCVRARLSEVCATVLVYASHSSFPGAAAYHHQTVLKRLVRPALQSYVDGGGDPPPHVVSPLPTRKALAQQMLHATELYLRVGPSLVALTDAVPNCAVVSAAAGKSTMTMCDTRECTTQGGLLLLLRDLRHAVVSYETALGTWLRASSTMAPLPHEAVWHVGVIASWVARLPLTVPARRGIDAHIASSLLHETPLVPVQSVVRRALEAVALVRDAPDLAHPSCSDAASLWRALVQIAFSTVLSSTVTHLATEPHSGNAVDSRDDDPDRNTVQECVAHLAHLLDRHPALLRHVGNDSETEWVQLSTVLQVLSCRALADPPPSATRVTYTDANAGAEEVVVVSLQAHLLHDGLQRVLDQRPFAYCQDSAIVSSPSRLFLISFLRAWTAWIPRLLTYAVGDTNKATVPPSLVALRETMQSHAAHTHPTMTRRRRTTVSENSASRSFRRARQDTSACGFPVLPHRPKPEPATPSHAASGNALSATDLAHPSPPRARLSFATQLTDAIMAHWLTSLGKDVVGCADVDGTELVGCLHALTQIQAHRALFTASNNETPHCLSRSSSHAAEREEEEWLPPSDCAPRLRRQMCGLWSNLLQFMVGLGVARQSIKMPFRHWLPMFSALHGEFSGVLPYSGGVCATTSLSGAVTPYVLSSSITSDPSLRKLRALLHGLRPSVIDEAITLYDENVRQSCVALCRERGMHPDVFFSGLAAESGDSDTSWGWGLVQSCGCLEDPTCAMHLHTAVRVIWQRCDTLGSCGVPSSLQHHCFARCLLSVVPVAGEGFRAPRTPLRSLSHVHTTGRRQAALDWLLCELAEMWESSSLETSRPSSLSGATSSQRRVPQIAFSGRTQEQASRCGPRRPVGPCVVDAESDSWRPVRCAWWDLDAVWSGVCHAHAQFCATLRYGENDVARPHSVSCFESFYLAWRRAEMTDASFALSDDTDDEMICNGTFHVTPDVQPRHNLARCDLADVDYGDADTDDVNGSIKGTPDDDCAWLVDCPAWLCHDALSALLQDPVTLVHARGVPVTFILRLLHRCCFCDGNGVMACDSDHPSVTSEQLDDWCAWLFTIRLIDAVRNLRAELLASHSHGTPAPVRASHTTRLTTVQRIARDSRETWGSHSTSAVLSMPSNTHWDDLRRRCHDEASCSVSSVVLHMLLEESAPIEDVTRVLQRLDAEYPNRPGDVQTHFTERVKTMEARLRCCSRTVASQL